MFIIYSKTPCPACYQAKGILSLAGLEYTDLQLDNGQAKLPNISYYTLADLQEKLPGARTVPQIWYYDEDESRKTFPTHYIGGLNELKEFLKIV